MASSSLPNNNNGAPSRRGATPTTPALGKRGRQSSLASNDESTTKHNKRSSSQSGKGDGTTPAKANKGLRHFSMKVCKKVEEKGQTTYNEVADELVREFMAQRSAEAAANNASSLTPPPNSTPTTTKKSKGNKQDEEKNIRRRVYDALNVLMAMDIISKEKKDIRWKGLPANHDLEMLLREKNHRSKEVERKRECLQELLVQQVCFRNLVKRNRQRDVMMADQQQPEVGEQEKIPMPFIIVNTSSDAIIQCEMNPTRTEINFDFSMPFEVNDDNEILKRLGLSQTTFDDIRRMLPPELLSYCQEFRLLDNIIQDNDPSTTLIHDNNNNNNSYPSLPPPQPQSQPHHQHTHLSYPHYSDQIMSGTAPSPPMPPPPPPHHHHHHPHHHHPHHPNQARPTAMRSSSSSSSSLSQQHQQLSQSSHSRSNSASHLPY